MKGSTVVRIILWTFWTIWTAAYIYPKFFHDTLMYILEKTGEWIMNNPDVIILMIWALCTVALALNLALKLGKENDPLEEYLKLKRADKNDGPEIF